VAWGDRILPALRPAVKVYVASGRFLPSEGDAAVYAVPDRGLLNRAEANRSEVEAELTRHFGRPVRLKLVIDGGPPATTGPAPAAPSAPPPEEEDLGDWSEMQAAPDAAATPEQRLMDAFPGSEEVPGQ
jgi:hypothetical protein